MLLYHLLWISIFIFINSFMDTFLYRRAVVAVSFARRPMFRESLYISTRRTVNSIGNFVTTWRGLESLVIEGARANRLARAQARDAGLSTLEGANQLLQLEPIGIFSVIVSNA